MGNELSSSPGIFVDFALEGLSSVDCRPQRSAGLVRRSPGRKYSGHSGDSLYFRFQQGEAERDKAEISRG